MKCLFKAIITTPQHLTNTLDLLVMLGAAAEHIISHKQGFVLIFRTPEEWMQSTKDAFKSNDLPFKEL